MEGDDKKKSHRISKSSRKSKKSKEPKDKDKNVDPRIRNPKAFAFNNAVRAERKFRRTRDVQTKKERAPQVDRTPVEPPPFVVAIVGPAKVGKSTLFHNLIKHFTRQTLHDVKGPVTIVSGKKRRLTFLECNNDINSMIDTAKVADLVLLLVDASFGFEMEIFEFLNICQVHGFPQIMGVLTHLDLFKNKTQLKKTKKTLKHRFWTEVYPGSKLFYLSGYHAFTNSYPKNEIHNLARFMSVMKFRQTLWRSEHSYVIADRIEDLTSPDDIRQNPKVDRNICLYGYVHGTFLKPDMSVHIPGLGDYTPEAVTALDDPCPLPMKERVLRRSLNEKEKVIYAPFSGVGGIVYDNDAVYIDLGGSHSHHRPQHQESEEAEEVTPFVAEMRKVKATLDEKMESSTLKLFSSSNLITSADLLQAGQPQDETVEEDNEPDDAAPAHKNFELVHTPDGRRRRKVMFDEDDDVISEMREELKALKKKSTGIEPPSDSDESEDEIETVMASVSGVGSSKIEKSKPLHESFNATSLASKLKARLSKTEESSVVPESLAEQMDEGTSDDEGDDDDDASEMDDTDDEDDDGVELEDEDDDGVELDDEDDDGVELDDDIEPKYNFGEDPESIEISKAKRYAEAETGFYSRFHKRSIQKLIYEDSSDYLNIGRQADFDLANCTVKEVQGQGGNQEMSEDTLKNLFVGGDYAETAKDLLDADGMSGDEENYGDFEELDKDHKGEDEAPVVEGNEVQKSKKRDEMKKQLKEKFDMQYDEGQGGEDKTFYKEWKSEVEEQTKVNREFFKDVDDPSLLQDLQGFAPGSYVRFLLLRLPYEFMVNFDPQAASPLILGSLDSPNQETLAVVQARVKKHRWHPKILKTRDPIILSVGWRRFQTVALYSVHDHNLRNRMIKYTPEHLHCVANFWGPITPQGTGILGIAPQGFDGFRITLTGTILDMDKGTELVKKLKLIGHPAKIFKKSCFVNGMFNSQLEVAKFVGAKIKTVSGIRGVIKKQLRIPEGAFRATFEDRILLSDVVFCRTWAKVDVPKFYLSIPNFVMAQPRLVKTLGQLKREGNLHVEPNPDNLYTPVQRTVKEFKPLQIPRKLQSKLPYKDKPKVLAKLDQPKRIAVIKEPHERKMTSLLKVMKSRMNEKDSKEKAEKAKKAAERGKLMKKLEEKQTHRQKELRKKVFRTLGQMKNRDNVVPGGGRGVRRQFKKKG